MYKDKTNKLWRRKIREKRRELFARSRKSKDKYPSPKHLIKCSDKWLKLLDDYIKFKYNKW